MATVRPAAFVGRERELGILTTALARTRLGSGAAVAITGEPGIGKTRLAEELAASATADGCATAWGTAWTAGGAPPLWPWHELLAQLGTPHADELLTLHQPGDAERFLRFRSVTTELARHAAERPLLLILDDLHAVDPAAVLLARFTARMLRRAPVLLVVTARDVAPSAAGADALATLLGESTRLQLTGLDEAAVAELVAADGPGRDPSALADLTGGNPLLLNEALASEATENLSEVSDWVRRLLLQRLSSVPQAGHDVLAAAAVLGPAADDAAVAALAEVDLSAVAATHEAARAAGFLRREADRHFVFSHALLRDALLDSRGAISVAEMHARAAVLVQSRPGFTAVAGHLLAAARYGAAPADTAVAAARDAARDERKRGAHERAARLLRAAIELSGEAATAGLWLEVAQAELAGGRLSASRPAFLAALQDAGADPTTRATAAIGLGGIWVFEHREAEPLERFLAVLETAIVGLGDQRPDLAARLRARLAAERIYLGRGTVDDVRAEVAVLRELDDAVGLAETLSLLHHVLLGPQDADERAAVIAELVATAARTGDTVLVLMAALWQTVDRFLAGAPDAERSLSELRQRADALRVDAVLYIAELMDVMLAARSGRLAEAEAAAHRCFEKGVDIGDADAVGYFGAQLLFLRWLQGRSAEMLPLAREIAGSPTVVAAAAHRVYPAALAALAADAGAGAAEEGRRQLDALVAEGLDTIAPSSNWLLTLFCIVEAADRLGDAAAAAAAYRELRPYAGLPVMASLGVMCFGCVDRALGLAARATGRLDDAVAHFETAMDVDRRLGNRPMLALSRGDLGETLLRRGRGDDGARGTALLGLAVAALEGMGLGVRAERYRAVAPPGRADDASLRLVGGAWEIAAGGERAVVPDGVGMRYLAHLLAAPGTDIAADELAGGGHGDRARQDVLDDLARTAYRRRIVALRAELDGADAAGDPDRATRAQDELDKVLEALAAATGLGGRGRTFADGRERARTAVQKAIRRAVARIGEGAPELGALLAASVQTGLVCRYEPAAGAPPKWDVSSG